MCVCMCECMYVWMCVYMCVCTPVTCMHVCIYACMPFIPSLNGAYSAIWDVADVVDDVVLCVWWLLIVLLANQWWCPPKKVPRAPNLVGHRGSWLVVGYGLMYICMCCSVQLCMPICQYVCVNPCMHVYGRWYACSYTLTYQ